MPTPRPPLQRPAWPLWRLAPWAAACVLSGCASTGPAPDRDPAQDEPSTLAPSLQALAEGRNAPATEAAQRWVHRHPGSAQGHLVLAAGLHLAGDPASLDLAASGYGAARQLGGPTFWPTYLAGVAAFQRNQTDAALTHFAEAALAQPDQPWGLEGLAAAAYAQGRLDLAQAASRRALALDPQSGPAWRVALLSSAAMGERHATAELLAQAPAPIDPAQQRWAHERAQLLVRTAAVDQPPVSQQLARAADAVAPLSLPGAGTSPTSPSTSNGTPPTAGGEPQQLTVDVTLILADGRKSRAYGVNLLDGLQMQFGQERTSTRNGGSNGDSVQTAITRAIRIPDVAYNLNIFNRGSRYYEVMARPSLTAFTGQQSTFFVGEQLHVQVSGVNTAQLEKIDVGVTLKITPSEVRADGARFRVEADRSFFSDQGVGSFKEQLATFKQSVAATADVRFGETLVLSGLSESLRDGQSSRVPVLGDIPGPDVLFSRSTNLERQRSVIVLVTPSLPLGLARTTARSPALDRLIALWDEVIEPRMGGPALVNRLRKLPSFTRAAAGDALVRDLSDPAVRRALVASLEGLPGAVAPAPRLSPPAATRRSSTPETTSLQGALL
ncbi:MAG: hypothetical protein ACK5W4_13400 [Inhella sp.]|uniref:hypothetical protein n=1 Tax=Inhella sp. TaxID=1921806 RepID=UPI00391F8944